MGSREYNKYCICFDIAEGYARLDNHEEAKKWYDEANVWFEAYEYACGLKSEDY